MPILALSYHISVNTNEVLGSLHKHPAFEGADLIFLEYLAGKCSPLDLKAGQVLFAQGDFADGGYLVIEGLIRLFVESGGEETKTLRYVASGDSFAEPMMFGLKAYPVCAEAVSATRLVHVPSSVVVQAIKKSPEVALGMLRTLSMRLKHHVDSLHLLSIPEAKMRLLIYLQGQPHQKMNRDGWAELKLVLGRKDLASRLNLAPETVGRTVAELLKEKVVRLGNHKVREIHLYRLDQLIRDQARGTKKPRGSRPSVSGD